MRRDVESVRFVHEWDIDNRPDRYLEHEVLDLTGPRSYAAMDSELYTQIRAYSPEHGYWSVTNGEFDRSSAEQLANAMTLSWRFATGPGKDCPSFLRLSSSVRTARPTAGSFSMFAKNRSSGRQHNIFMCLDPWRALAT